MLSGAIVGACGLVSCFRRQQYICSFFIAIFILMYFPNPFAIGLGLIDLERGTDSRVFAQVNASLLVGLSLFLAGTRLFARRRPVSMFPRIHLTTGAISFAVFLAILSAILGLCITVVASGGWTAIRDPRGAHTLYTTSTYYRLIGAYLLYPLLLSPLIIVQLPRAPRWAGLIIVAGILIVFLYLYRSRTAMIASVISCVIGLLLKHRVIIMHTQQPLQRLPWIRRLVFVSALTASVFIGGVSLRFLRGFISRPESVHLDAPTIQAWVRLTFEGGDLGYTPTMRAAYTVFPSSHTFLLGQSYYRVLLAPIPRFIFPTKPENTQRIFCRVVNPELADVGGTIPPGIIGDLYINFGHLGLIGMFFYGMLLSRGRFWCIRHWLFLGGTTTWLFHFVRGGFTNPLITATVFLVLVWVYEKILNPYYAEPYVCESDQEGFAY